MDLDIATRLAQFLQQYGGWALSALLILALVKRDHDYRRAEREKFELALKLAPLADKMLALVERAAKARRRQRDTPPPEPRLAPAFPESDESPTNRIRLPGEK